MKLPWNSLPGGLYICTNFKTNSSLERIIDFVFSGNMLHFTVTPKCLPNRINLVKNSPTML